MSTFSAAQVIQRLSAERLSSYLRATNGDVDRSLALYDWNSSVSGALYEDIGRIEVVFRNALDQALTVYGADRGWPTVWFSRSQLFPGRHGERAQEDIGKAQRRARQRNSAEVHGKVIAELTFGFWRYLCSGSYLTSLWVPALTRAFPNHPRQGDPRAVRSEVEKHIQRIHFLRNRIAHYEPIHQRNLHRDVASIFEIAVWIDGDAHRWIVSQSRTTELLQMRP